MHLCSALVDRVRNSSDVLHKGLSWQHKAQTKKHSGTGKAEHQWPPHIWLYLPRMSNGNHRIRIENSEQYIPRLLYMCHKSLRDASSVVPPRFASCRPPVSPPDDLDFFSISFTYYLITIRDSPFIFRQHPPLPRKILSACGRLNLVFESKLSAFGRKV